MSAIPDCSSKSSNRTELEVRMRKAINSLNFMGTAYMRSNIFSINLPTTSPTIAPSMKEKRIDVKSVAVKLIVTLWLLSHDLCVLCEVCLGGMYRQHCCRGLPMVMAVNVGHICAWPRLSCLRWHSFGASASWRGVAWADTGRQFRIAHLLATTRGCRRGGVAGAEPPHKGGPNRPDRPELQGQGAGGQGLVRVATEGPICVKRSEER